MNLSIEVTNCRDCPMRRPDQDSGDYCSHKDSPSYSYDSNLDNINILPQWCPIKDK